MSYSHLVYAARGDNVRATIVEGAVLYLDGEFRTIDVAATIAAAARSQANRVREAVGLPVRIGARGSARRCPLVGYPGRNLKTR